MIPDSLTERTESTRSLVSPQQRWAQVSPLQNGDHETDERTRAYSPRAENKIVGRVMSRDYKE